MRNELTVVYVSNSETSNHSLLEKLYLKCEKELKDIHWEFVLSSPKNDFSNLNKDIKFASNKNNVVCVKANGNKLYHALQEALYVANYKVAFVVDVNKLSEETIEDLDISSILDKATNSYGFSFEVSGLGYAMKTFYVKSMVKDIKFTDDNLYNEMLYTSGLVNKDKRNRLETRLYKKYFKKGLKLKRLYGVC